MDSSFFHDKSRLCNINMELVLSKKEESLELVLGTRSKQVRVWIGRKIEVGALFVHVAESIR